MKRKEVIGDMDQSTPTTATREFMGGERTPELAIIIIIIVVVIVDKKRSDWGYGPMHKHNNTLDVSQVKHPVIGFLTYSSYSCCE